MKPAVRTLLLLVLGALWQPASVRAADWHSYTFQFQAHAPNAGGQSAYSLRRGNDRYELSLFRNEYLLAGDQPIMGGGYAKKFKVCGQKCFWQFFVLTGLGVSTGGPYLELAWVTVPLWLVRIDMTTQLYATKNRLVSWNMPFWLGINLPLPI